MKLSIIIPIYNEARHLKEFFEMIVGIDFKLPTELIVIDDCSTDDSWEITQAFAGKRADMILHRQTVNAGKGSAIHRGIELASGDIIAINDADFEYDPNDLVNLVACIVAGRADIVYGSRFKKTNPQVHRTFHYLGNRVLTLVSNVMSGLYLSDMETCYKVFRAPIIKALELRCRRFGFEPEVTAAIAHLKVRIFELPISYFPRNYLEGKKINWKDGVAAIWFIFKFNLRDLSARTKQKMPPQYLLERRPWL